MQLSHFVRWATRRFPDAFVGEAAQEGDLKKAERRLGVHFPQQVRDFYQTCDGIFFPQPFLRILRLSELEFIGESKLLRFCIAANNEEIAFDTSNINNASQWFIKGVSEDHTITFTMASFWSQKLRGWLECGRPIWSAHEYKQTHDLPSLPNA